MILRCGLRVVPVVGLRVNFAHVTKRYTFTSTAGRCVVLRKRRRDIVPANALHFHFYPAAWNADAV